jgi:TM2 domain-containing membrane protein YozV
MVFCTHSERGFSFGDVSYCPTCGKPRQDVSTAISQPPQTHSKKPQNTLAISILAGAVAFHGVGHLYVGKITKGIKLMIVGWILVALTILFPPFGVIYFVFWIWQAYDAYRIVKHRKENRDKKGNNVFW